MTAMLTDADLSHLLTEAADSFPPPDHAAVVARAQLPAAAPPLYRRRWVQATAAAAAVVVASVLAGGLTAGRHAPAGSSTPATLRAPNSSTGGLAGGGLAAGGLAGGGPAGGGALAPGAAPPGAITERPALTSPLKAFDAAPQTGPAGPAAQAPLVDGARVVKTGEISLVVGNGLVSRTLTAVGEAATAAGGYVSSSDSQEYGTTPSGTVTLRVPVGKFESVVSRVRSLNAKVRTATLSGKDVTADYADLQAQLTTLKAARNRFLDLLAKAQTIGEILTVQQKVDDTTGQIDRLEGQRRVLASQSDLATLAVTVTQADDPVVTPIAKPRSGLAQAWYDAKDGFVSGVEGLIRRSGRVALFLICAAVVLLGARAGWRLVRRRLV